MDKTTDDMVLLALWRKGRIGAGNELIRRHYENILKRVYRRLRGDEQASLEITQQAFAILAARKDNVNSNVGGYLWRIALNKILMHVWRRSRECELKPTLLFTDASALQHIEAHEESKIMIKALRSLSVEDQLLIKWVYADKRAQRDIAEALNLRVSQVNGKIHRSRERLRESITNLRDSEAKISTLGGFDTWLASIHGKSPTE